MKMKELIKEIDFRSEKLEQEYIGVTFDHCDFTEFVFGDVLFEDCVFTACNLSLCKSHKTSWNGVHFEGCKMTGINFSDANRFTFRASFKDCQLQYASFQGLSLIGTRFEGCLLEEANYADCILKKAVFNECELRMAEFTRCNLEYADFTTARGYVINPNENRLSHAKFSRYGVEGLLATYKIEIV